MNRIIGMLKAAGLCSDVLYKELYIPQKEIDSASPPPPPLLVLCPCRQSVVF